MVQIFDIDETRKALNGVGRGLITPDRMYIPELGVSKRFDAMDAMVFVFHSGTFYTSGMRGTHPMIYGRENLWGPGIDGRLWKDAKVFSFWYREGDDNPLFEIEEINKQFNVEDYQFVFLGIVNGEDKVVSCSYDDIPKIRWDIRPVDTENLRWIWSGGVERRKPRKKTDSSAYGETCRYWENRIGGMDVAEWHLLMYEE